MNSAVLEEFGLSSHEATVYLGLLRIGETKTGPLVKQTQLHRVQIYDALDRLIKKGLATYVIKENRKYFQAADPTRIKDFLHEKQERADEILPELIGLQNLAGRKQSVQLFEGIRGLKSAMNSMLRELSPGGKHWVFGGGHMSDAMGSYYDVFQQFKKRNNIKTYGILNEKFRERKTVIERTSAQLRYYPLADFPSDTWIYNDKVLIVTYTASPMIAILIQSQETADSYKAFFDGYWKQAKK